MQNSNSRPTSAAGDSPQDWARAAMDGDEAAFNRLHARLEAGLLRHFQKRVGWQSPLADELAQKTWSTVWQALRDHRYDPARAAFSTFLYAVGSKVWLQYGRSRKSAPVALDAPGMESLAEPAHTDNPGDLLEQAELLDAVRNALHATDQPDSLTDNERHIVLSAARGATDRALAAELGVAASTVNVRKQAAYAKLRRALARRGLTDESGERTAENSE